MFITMFVAGAVLEVIIVEGHYWFFKKHFKENHYTLRKYLFLLVFPLLGLILLTGTSGLSIIADFLIFGILGTALEGIIGWAYHMIVGQRLWTFHKYSIYQYTSWLSIPIWGFIGIVFYLLAQVL